MLIADIPVDRDIWELGSGEVQYDWYPLKRGTLETDMITGTCEDEGRDGVMLLQGTLIASNHQKLKRWEDTLLHRDTTCP